jgi:hypothetical protein
MSSFVWGESGVGTERRINLSQDLVKQVAWLKGKVGIDAWVLTLGPGRYRIIPHSQLEQNGEFKRVVERITSMQAGAPGEPFEPDSPESAALPSRLLQVTISPGASWRLNLSGVPLFDATGEEIKVLVQVLSDGYIELWSALRFAQAQTAPIHQIVG